MLLRLNANQYRGFLYKFVDSIETIDKIINGYEDEWVGSLRPGISFGWDESTWDTNNNPKIKTDLRNYRGKGDYRISQFSSWTRNPYGIIEEGVEDWKYAIIIDGSKVDDSEIVKPMNYGTIPNQWYNYKLVYIPKDAGSFRGYVDYDNKNQTQDEWERAADPYVRKRGKGNKVPGIQLPPGWYLYYLNKGVNSEKYVKITNNQAKELLDWYNGDAYMYQANIGDESFLPTYEEVLEDDSTLGVWAFSIHVNKKLQWKDMPGILWRLAVQSFPQSEERFYEPQGTKKRQGSRDKNDRYKMDISKALWGILIPDVEYFDEEVQHWIKKHSNLQVRIYRDMLWNPSSDKEYQEFKEMVRLNPEVKELYKLPG